MQNENGSRITMEEYWKLPIEEVFSNKWTEVVTNAEIVEFSFVSVRSNRASVLTTKVEQYARVNKIDTKQVYSLISNNLFTLMTSMKLKYYLHSNLSLFAMYELMCVCMST